MGVPKTIKEKAINPAHEARLLCRENLLKTTIGKAAGYLHANLIVLPSAYAGDFRDLCARNPVPCPLLGYTPVGNPHKIVPSGCIQSDDFDIRTDFPGYRILWGGHEVAVKTDINEEWTDDHVGFLLGCSLSFEDAMIAKGHKICHIVSGTKPAMYRTSIPVLPAGVFHGATFVVSMRTCLPEQVDAIREICRPYLASHGEPVAWGWDGAKQIGIQDVYKPEYGDIQTFESEEVPVFWACGVTPQLVVEKAGTAIEGIVMSHDPGCVIVTDWKISDVSKLAGFSHFESG